MLPDGKFSKENMKVHYIRRRLIPLTLILAIGLATGTVSLAANKRSSSQPSDGGVWWDGLTAEIDINPSSLISIQEPDTLVSHTLTISNVGGADLNWTIIEEASPRILDGSSPETHWRSVETRGIGKSRTEDSAVSGEGTGPNLSKHPAGNIAIFNFPGAPLHDNGPLVNSAGTGVGDADESILQDLSQGMNTRGFGNQVVFGNRIADDFTVSDANGWIIDEVLFFGYEVNSPITSTFSAVNFRIWDGIPGDPGSNVIFGDTATNRLTHSIWSGIFRVTELSSGSSNARPIMANTASAGVYLPSGTYWLDWQADVITNTFANGPWAPPISVSGTITTGNGLQSFDNGATWEAVRDSGTLTAQGFPFIITGEIACTPSDILWITVSPDNGTTVPGSASTVTVLFDSTDLSVGTYQGNICAVSNDPTNPAVLIPLTMEVPLTIDNGNYLPIIQHNDP
jgi:hypothetical protein